MNLLDDLIRESYMKMGEEEDKAKREFFSIFLEQSTNSVTDDQLYCAIRLAESLSGYQLVGHPYDANI